MLCELEGIVLGIRTDASYVMLQTEALRKTLVIPVGRYCAQARLPGYEHLNRAMGRRLDIRTDEIQDGLDIHNEFVPETLQVPYTVKSWKGYIRTAICER